MSILADAGGMSGSMVLPFERDMGAVMWCRFCLCGDDCSYLNRSTSIKTDKSYSTELACDK